MADASPAGWLFLQPDRLPDRWRHRARPAVYVPLLAQELDELLDGHLSGPALTSAEERLAALVADGRSVQAIARELGLAHRTIERRIAALRDRLGVRSSADLALALCARGFAMAASPTPAVGGPARGSSNVPLLTSRARGR
jgi:DNA-binding CsgD family transcriptional regulator